MKLPIVGTVVNTVTLGHLNDARELYLEKSTSQRAVMCTLFASRSRRPCSVNSFGTGTGSRPGSITGRVDG
ncbi:hypothetical protein Y032_0029g1927 [Ancylostoma ceylanicum]|uniref:Uncharacterized protein n=1 Tax=Ancylostoma ceylanicum TaxID=53326 RepID=A0A016URN3_9BILA|nr:hypothetical protein Y032_0029g1927 [Ancylostoma ceylanicum]